MHGRLRIGESRHGPIDPRVRRMKELEQTPTGVPGLDRLLRGGLRRRGLYAILGETGCGKSVLAHQIGAAFAARGQRVLYLTALVESHPIILAQARTFRFFDPAWVPDDFYYAALYPALERDGLEGVHEEITRSIRERRPGLIVVDGGHVLETAAGSAMEFIRFLNALQTHGSVLGGTILLVANQVGRVRPSPIFTMPDAVLLLGKERVGRRDFRTIAVKKYRGVAHIEGSHLIEITRDGIRVYPRLESVTTEHDIEARTPPVEPLAFGIDGLDAMLAGGPTSCSTTLVAGTSGAGKTLLGLAFLAAGARAGYDGLFLGFHETPDRLVDKADAAGIPLREGIDAGKIQFLWKPSTELIADRVAEEILERVENRAVRCIAIDGLVDLLHAIPYDDRRLRFLNALSYQLRTRGTGVVLTLEVPRIFGTDIRLPVEGISAAVDNIILLRYVEPHGELRRLVSILKVRERDYDTSIREFTITSQGIRIGERVGEASRLPEGMFHPRTTPGSD
jgi:circadian clock protein KaiC